jgi:hypothetical protein
MTITMAIAYVAVIGVLLIAARDRKATRTLVK